MDQERPQNGTIELRFNSDRTLALANIYPATNGGESVTIGEVRERLQAMGVSYGVAEDAIQAAIDYTRAMSSAAIDVVVAQGVIPVDGASARIHYRLPAELLAQRLPSISDHIKMPDWCNVDRQRLVRAGQELAAIIPAQPGVPGKTLTWPIKSVAPVPGRPANVFAGANVSMVDGTHLLATADGFVCLSGDTLTVHAMHLMDSDVSGDCTVPAGFAVRGNAIRANIRTAGFVVVSGAAVASRIRADQDIVLSYAENCEIATPGSVYVLQGVKNCSVTARGKFVAPPGAHVAGGCIRASAGVEAGSLGAETCPPTEVHMAVDGFAKLRNQEISEEYAACEANIKRIVKALEPFASNAAASTLSDDKRSLMQKLLLQKRSLDAQLNHLLTERRNLNFFRIDQMQGIVCIAGTVWPGVRIAIGDAAKRVEEKMTSVRFQRTPNGKSVQVVSLLDAVA